MAEEKEDHTDRFGWHPSEAVVKLVPGVEELRDAPPQPERDPKPRKKDADREA